MHPLGAFNREPVTNIHPEIIVSSNCIGISQGIINKTIRNEKDAAIKSVAIITCRQARIQRYPQRIVNSGFLLVVKIGGTPAIQKALDDGTMYVETLPEYKGVHIST